MALLTFGVVVFMVIHLSSAVPALKSALQTKLGAKAFGPAFGVASLLSIVVIVFGWRTATFVPIYEPPVWGRHANYVMTLVAFLFFGVFLFRGNLRNMLRFPMGLAVLFWATGHLLANGDLASLILFGGMLSYAAIHVAILVTATRFTLTEVRSGHDGLSLFAGLALYGIMAQLHTVLIGVPVFQLTP